jgi:putative ABC transport system substrate-binding protein
MTIVYTGGQDAIDVGLVDSLNRPGGNVTGVSQLVNALIPKRLQMLRALAPRATHIAILINPLGMQIDFWKVGTEAQLNVAFATHAHQVDALLVPPEVLFQTLSPQIIALAQRHSMPAMYAAALPSPRDECSPFH